MLVLNPFRSGRLAIAASLFACAACSTLPSTGERIASFAYADTADTRLGQVAAASVRAAGADAPSMPPSAAAAIDDAASGRAIEVTPPVDAATGPLLAPSDPRRSGFHLIATGDEAYATLFTLIRNAQRSLDLQYYLVEDDPYARTLLRAAREAAERGVRVRLLVDDLYTAGKDERIVWYSSHPNIQVRVFNAFGVGRPWLATRIASSIFDLARINHRMHNKLFVADNAFAVTGGRNLGAAYYTRSRRTNFLDLDVLAAGPIVADLSEAFDTYWNSRYAIPIEHLATRGELADGIDERALRDPNDPVRAATREALDTGRPLQAALDAGRVPLVDAAAVLIADRPGKVDRSAPRAGPGGFVSGASIASDIVSIARNAREELVIVTPYFVPGERGVTVLGELIARGVKVRVITNSLAATDAAIVHIGYAHYRRRLLAMGVEIDELRPEPGDDREGSSLVGSSKASLHAKVLVVDGRTMFVGSFNVDQRSALENTEMGVEIASPVLAGQVLERLRMRGPQSRYRVTLEPDGRLAWTTEDGGTTRVYHEEPEVGRWLRLTLSLLAPFAPEQML